MKKQTARFFCENCNSEVGRDDKVCARCGHFFASVRCPNCGMMGEPSQFKSGCPQCGYAMDLSSYGIPKPGSKDKKKGRSKGVVHKDERLPVWLYILTSVVLVAVVVGVFFYLGNI